MSPLIQEAMPGRPSTRQACNMGSRALLLRLCATSLPHTLIDCKECPNARAAQRTETDLLAQRPVGASPPAPAWAEVISPSGRIRFFSDTWRETGEKPSEGVGRTHQGTETWGNMQNVMCCFPHKMSGLMKT